MALTAAKFQALSDKFIQKTFVGFAKVMTMRLADAVVYGSPQTWTSEAGTAIALALDSSKFGSQLIQVGDFLLFTNASQWTIDPRVDNVDLIFDGQSMQIVLVEKDPADAGYFITVRAK